VNAEYRRLDVRLDAESENYPQCTARPRSLDPFYIEAYYTRLLGHTVTF